MCSTSKVFTKLIVCCFVLFGLFYNLHFNVFADSINEIISTDEFEVGDKIISFDVINNFEVIHGEHYDFFIYNKEAIKTKFRIKDIFKSGENIYLLSDQRVYSYNINNESIEEIIYLKDHVLNSLFISDSIVYLVGSFDHDACLYLYTGSGLFVESYTYGGSGNEEFLKIFGKDNFIYVVGSIDKNSPNSPFKNTGNNGKSIVLVNFKNNIFSTFYDHIYLSTSLNSILFDVLFSDNIGLIVDDEYYELDYNFQIIPSKKIGKINYLIPSLKGIIRVSQEDNKWYLNKDYVVNCEENISYIGYSDNLYFYSFEVNKLKRDLVFSYQIVYNDPVMVSYFRNLFDVDDYFKIDCFFTTYQLTNNLSDIKKNMPGIHELIYYLKAYERVFEIKSSLTVLEYVCIVDKGIYQKGLELSFFGDGYLDGKQIYNGYIVNQEGEHNLVIKTLDKTIEYSFVILDEYYKSDNVCSFECDYYIKPNETVCVVLTFTNEIKITDVYINHEHYEDFKVNLNQLLIYIHGKPEYSIDYYCVNSVTMSNDGELEEIRINDDFYVCTLKESPKVSLYETLVDNKISLEYSVIDNSKTIFYVLKEYYYKNELLFANYDYFVSNKNKVDKNYEYLNEIEYLVYHDGENFKKIKLNESKMNNFSADNFEECAYIITDNLSGYKKLFLLENADFEFIKVNNENTIENLKIINKTISTKTVVSISVGIVLLGLFIILIKLIIAKKVRKKEN